MKTITKILFAATITFLLGCAKTEVTVISDGNTPSALQVTKAIGDKCPMISVYVETNDVNPLNAGDYYFEDTGESFFDIVELFASNIVSENVYGLKSPVLTLNDKLTNILENGGVEKYVRPLQEYGIKVNLTVIGHHSGIGLANMNDTQADQFATILAYVVEKYGLDGIGLNDEYADYPSGSVNDTSFSRIIMRLRELMPEDKMITVFDWGYTSSISDEAAACIDYAYHGYYGSYVTMSGIAGMNKERWSPMSYNLGQYIPQSTVQNYAVRCKNGGYGAIMMFNLRTRDNRDSLPAFQAIADGAYEGRHIVCDDGNRPRDVEIVNNWYRITYDMAKDYMRH